VNAPTTAELERILNKLDTTFPAIESAHYANGRVQKRGRPSAGDYLRLAIPSTWAIVAIPGGHTRRFGQRTSNAAECLNALLKTLREKPVLELLHGIWLWTMGKFSDRAREAQKAIDEGQCFTAYCNKKLQTYRETARQHTVTPSSAQIFYVQHINEQFAYIVDLQQLFCSCHHFQDYAIPCAHAMAAIFYRQERIDEHVPNFYHARAWAATYAENGLKAVTLNEVWNAEGNQKCAPPVTKQVLGKRQKQRMETGHKSRASGEKRQKCSSCKNVGHNSSSCKQRTMKNLVT